MSSRVISEAELRAHAAPGSAWLAISGRVYDVTEFAASHPGGPELLHEMLGRDATDAFLGTEYHKHSDAAQTLLSPMQVGILETYAADQAASQAVLGSAKTQELASRIIDPKKPYTFQVGLLGRHYQEWVHTPMHTKEPLVLLGSWMEPFTKVHWWVPLVFWIPAVIAMLWYAVLQWPLYKVLPLYLGMAVVGWPFLEYFLHRVIYHMSTESYWANTAHFLFHGVHHLTPMDKTRLVAPPPLAIFISLPLWCIVYPLSPSYPFLFTFAAGLYSGYLVYDEIHYWIHHGNLPWEWMKRLKSHHMAHHYAHPNENFGVSNTFTDVVFGTLALSERK